MYINNIKWKPILLFAISFLMIITSFIVVAFAISEESKYTGVIVVTSVIAVTVCIVFLLKSLLNMFDYKDERIQRDKRLMIINNSNRSNIFSYKRLGYTSWKTKFSQV